jgi:hypothetical protein
VTVVRNIQAKLDVSEEAHSLFGKTFEQFYHAAQYFLSMDGTTIDNPAKWRQRPSFIAGPGVDSCSRKSNSIQPLSPLRRSNEIIDGSIF